MTENISEVVLFVPYQSSHIGREFETVQIRCGSEKIARKYVRNKIRKENRKSKRNWRKIKGFLGELIWVDMAERCLFIRTRRLYK